MEIKVESVDNSLPPKCYVGIRSGGVQKQAQYDPKTRYRFSDAKRFSKIEIFQRIGTCDIAWGGDDTETRTCKALDANKCETAMRMKISMNRVGLNPKMSTTAPLLSKAGDISGGTAQANTAKADTANKSAKYISEHRVEDILTSAMRALLKHVPDDAPTFLCDFIAHNYGKHEGGHLIAPTQDSAGRNVADRPGCIVQRGEGTPRSQILHQSNALLIASANSSKTSPPVKSSRQASSDAESDGMVLQLPPPGSDELTPSPHSPAAPLSADWLSDLPDKFKTPSGSEADLSNLIESLHGASPDKVTECLSGVPLGRLKKLEKAAGVRSLVEGLQSATSDEIAECLCGLPVEERKKLEKRQGLQLVAPAKVQQPGDHLKQSTFARPFSSQVVATDLSNVSDNLRDATLDQVADCLSGVTPGEVESLEKLVGVQRLLGSLHGSTIDDITECLSSVPLEEFKKLDKCRAVELPSPKSARGRDCPRSWSPKVCEPGGPQSSQAPQADFSNLIESLQGATLGEVVECLSGMPPGDLKKLEKGFVSEKALRQKARGVLLTGLANGTLAETLSSSTHENALRQKPNGSANGTLEETLSKEEALRQKARGALLTGSVNGSLAELLAKTKDGEALRQTAREALLTGSANGTLAESLSKAKAQAVRQRAREALVIGSANGTLAESLSKAQDVRQKAREALLTGLANGTLAQSLSSTAHLTEANVAPSTKQPAASGTVVNPSSSSASIALREAAAQLKIPLQAKPSVATWYSCTRSTRRQKAMAQAAALGAAGAA